jgi:hypothetical protein
MPILHYRVHILEVKDPTVGMVLRRSKPMQRALLLELDAAHWLIDGRHLNDVEKACAKAGVAVKIHTYGE